MSRRPGLDAAGALVAGLLLAACGGSAPGGRVMVEADSPAVGGPRLVETISIEVSEGELAPILERGCALPCTEPVTFGVAEEAQTEIAVYVFRGNTSRTDDAEALGVYEIAGFPLVSGEDVDVPVIFGADATGIWIEPAPDAPPGVTVARMDRVGSLDFEALASAYPRLAEERAFTARDGTELPVRTYGDAAPIDLILVHGSGAWNAYLSDLAARIADSGAAVVHTPDLRGHGAAPDRRGDVDYADQLEDDLADLVDALKALNPERRIVVGGHSSGGGLAVRMAGGPHAGRVDGWLLLAPYLGHDAPTTRPNSGGWAKPRLARIVGLTMLNAVGVTALNDATVLEFDLPEDRRSGNETPSYSFRMMSAINPRDMAADLGALCAPALVVVGSRDEAFVAEAFAPAFAEHAPHARVVVVPEAGHLGLVGHEDVPSLAIAWLRTVSSGEAPGRCP